MAGTSTGRDAATQPAGSQQPSLLSSCSCADDGSAAGGGQDRVRLNVGGRHFETTVGTLAADPDCMLARLCAQRWNDRPAAHGRGPPQEHFIDRDGRHFHTVLNHLRDAGNCPLPDDPCELAELLIEAEYFQVCSLAERCRHRLADLRRAHCDGSAGGDDRCAVGDTVQWRPDAVDLYWRAFAETLVADGIEIPFGYDRVGRKYSDKHGFAVCFACMQRVDLDTVTVFDYKIRCEQWEPLRHHMRRMRGTVAKRLGRTCALVAWDNGASVHLPLSALFAVAADAPVRS